MGGAWQAVQKQDNSLVGFSLNGEREESEEFDAVLVCRWCSLLELQLFCLFAGVYVVQTPMNSRKQAVLFIST